MPALRRILKYTPTVAIGLLVVLWTVNIFWRVWVFPPQLGSSHYHMVSLSHGGLTYFHVPGSGWDRNYSRGRIELKSREATLYLGMRSFNTNDPSRARVMIPYSVLITAILPLALGPILSFRFRLWHYLAYTALVAVELAYY